MRRADLLAWLYALCAQYGAETRIADLTRVRA